jgi:hypothetical protein
MDLYYYFMPIIIIYFILQQKLVNSKKIIINLDLISKIFKIKFKKLNYDINYSNSAFN